MNHAEEYVKSLYDAGFRSYEDLQTHPYHKNKLLHYLFNPGDEQKNARLVNVLFDEAQKDKPFDPWHEYGIPAVSEI